MKGLGLLGRCIGTVRQAMRVIRSSRESSALLLAVRRRGPARRREKDGSEEWRARSACPPGG